MKCPKCGYLGFETTDRCRNCGYDFSLAPFSPEPDLSLRNPEKDIEQAADFDLPGTARQPDPAGAGALDLDRLFGDDGTSATAAAAPEPGIKSRFLNPPPPATSEPRRVVMPNTQVVDIPKPPRDEPPYVGDAPRPAPTTDVGAMTFAVTPPGIAQPVVEAAKVAKAAPFDVAHPDPRTAPSALPFEETLHVAPPPARQPLGVRRTTPEFSRGRSRSARPARSGSLLELGSAPESAQRTEAAEQEFLLDPPSIGARVGADAIDALLLAVIDAVVLVLTLRLAGLSMTLDDMRIVPAIPFVGFLMLLAFVYIATFTVAGGQTIGKMVTGVKVIGDDGRSVNAADGVLRALACLLVPLTLGLSYAPVFLTTDGRALHDRLAGTRVVSQ